MDKKTVTATIEIYDGGKPGGLRLRTHLGDADCGPDGKFSLAMCGQNLIVSKPGSMLFAEVDLRPLIEQMIDHLIVRAEAS